MSSIAYDDAIIATVAKNVAFGIGYKTTFYDKEVLYDPGISTGAPIVLPATLLILIFGNKYWVPGITIVFINNILLISILLLLRKQFADRTNLKIFASLFLFIFVIFPSQGLLYTFLGEIPASLLLILAAVVVFKQPYNKKTLFIGGLLLGTAYLTKALALFGILGLLISIIIFYRDITNRVLAVALVIIGFLLPPSTFVMAERIHFMRDQTSGWSGHLEASRQFTYNTGSGIRQFLDSKSKINYFIMNFKHNTKLLIQYFGGTWIFSLFVIIFLSILIMSFVNLFYSKNNFFIKLLGISFINMFLIHFIWWLFVSPLGWYRHLIEAIVYVIAGVSLLITALGRYRKLGFIIAIVTLVVIQRRSFIKELVISCDFKKEKRLVALLETVDFIQKSIPEGTILTGAGHWSNPDLEYLLPGSNNFKNYLEIKDKKRKESNKNVYLVRSDIWNWEKSEVLEKIQLGCEKNIIYKNDPFIISQCNNEN